MDPQNNLKQLQDLFNNAKDILIITKEQPTIDGLCSCLALYHLLSNVKNVQGKNKRVVLAISGRNGTQYSLLPGSEKIVSELGLRDFVIGVNGYLDNAIENVNWYADKGRLNVVFKSNPEVPMQFDLKNLDPFYAGANFDVVVVIDTALPTDLGNAYRQDPGMYAELPVVNISKDTTNTRFGRVNIVDPQVGSVSELCYQLAQILRLPMTSDVAGLFNLGVRAGTNNFQNKGSQSDAVISQLQPFNPRNFDLDAVVAQSNGALLPIHKNGAPIAPASLPVNPQINPQINAQMPAPAQIPVNPYAQPYPYQNMQMQSGYVPPGFPQYYPQYQGQVPQQMPYGYPQYPVQMPPNMYQQQYAPIPPVQAETQAETEYVQPSIGEVQDYTQDVYEAAPQEYDVPSIEHDSFQQSDYIPTAEIIGTEHVEPSIQMQYVQQNAVFNPDPVLEERKEQYSVPDWSAPPKIFDQRGSKN